MARQAKRKSQTKPPPVNGQSRKFWILIAAAVAVLVASLLAVALLRDQNGGSNAITQRRIVHVHGLGVNASDGALYIATHTGMWRITRGGSKPEPIGKSHQDTMGFTIVGANHFLGSGHPDNFNQPPLLGLIESTDSGASWKPISLLGEADFHILRALGRRVYGYDASHSRLLISHDKGRSWTNLRPPEPLIDLVVNPTEPRRLFASTDRVLMTSADEGRTWKAVLPGSGLLAWPTSQRMFLVDGRGRVHVTENAGSAWKKVGRVGGPPAAFLAISPTDLYVALHDGSIKRSRDGGATWDIRLAS
jgi:photosystem II stability/assembly factor-like uncharacterized protein